MTRSRKNKNNSNNDSSALAVVNGSLAARTGGGKVKNVVRTRHFFEARSEICSSAQVLSASQSPYPIGSQFATIDKLFSVDQLLSNAQSWVQSYDKYRITNIEVFATLEGSNLTGNVQDFFDSPVEVYFYEDTDNDPNTTTSWIRVADRDNLGRVVLTRRTPSQRLISFKPTVTFAANSGTQNPANVVPRKNVWLDALAVSQVHAGLRGFACCPRSDNSGISYNFRVYLQTRYTVEATQPL